MGQKVHPIGFRLGVTKNWQASWFASRKPDFRANIQTDRKLRDFLVKKLHGMAVSQVTIERSPLLITVTIHTARPGMIIGRGGTGVEDLKKAVEKIVKKKVALNIQEVQSPEYSAVLVGQNIADQIERRIPYKRAVKAAIDSSMKAKAKGIKVTVSGRLGGAEIAREETYSAGSVPLGTLRANVDFARVGAFTTYGVVGLKIWIYLGEAPKLEFSVKQEEV